MTTKTIKILQLFIITIVAFYLTLIALGNIIDYDANYQFVKHVFAMDTTFKDHDIMWRAITNETAVRLAYWAIIVTEIVIAGLSWFASAKLCRRLKKSPEQFNAGKTAGIYALMLAISLWFVGFICIGSEWFAMWQSSEWNGKQTAMDIVTIMGIFALIYMVPVQALKPGPDKKT